MGLLAFGPLGLLMYLITIMSAMSSISLIGIVGQVFQLMLIVFFILFVLGILLGKILYIRHANRNLAIPAHQKNEYMVRFLFGGMIAIPRYFLAYGGAASQAPKTPETGILQDGVPNQPGQIQRVGPRNGLVAFGPLICYLLMLIAGGLQYTVDGKISPMVFLIVCIVLSLLSIFLAMRRLVRFQIMLQDLPQMGPTEKTIWRIGLWILNGPVSILFYLARLRNQA
jgi:hypothetical protein